MLIYIAALREYKTIGLVEQWTWVDTRDNVANLGTKLEPPGRLPVENLPTILRCATWEPKFPYRWGNTLVDPTPVEWIPLEQPPKAAKAVLDSLPQDPFRPGELPP